MKKGPENRFSRAFAYLLLSDRQSYFNSVTFRS